MNFHLPIALACGTVAVFLLAACDGDQTLTDSAAGEHVSPTASPSTFLLSLFPTPALTPMAVETTREASDYADDELPDINGDYTPIYLDIESV